MTSRPISAPTPHGTFSENELQNQVSRISASRVFEHSQTLQRLLRYLANKSIEAPGEQIKEYTVGVEALERRPDFDPKEDTIVRVQIHRLREKLFEYYKSEGMHDPILVTIPRGRYLPSFEAVEAPHPPAIEITAPAAEAAASEESAASEVEIEHAPPRGPRRRWGRTAAVCAAMVLVAVVSFQIGWKLRSRSAGQTGNTPGLQRAGAAPKAGPAQAFWSAFLGDDSAPIIVFADAVFLLDDSSDLFSYPHGAIDNRGAPVDSDVARRYASNPGLVEKAGKVYYESGYTGTGDLKAVAVLVRFLTQMDVTPIVKTSRDLTPEDLKEHCVIVLGSPFQNIAAAQLVPSDGFVFDSPTPRHEAWGGKIVNLRPGPTEASVYQTERDPVTHILKADYSVISIRPGIVPGRFIAVLAGLDTTGTEGAALFATSPSGIEAILRNSPAIAEEVKNKQAPLFQSLLRVTLAKGSEVMGSSLITVHVSSGKGAETPASRERDIAIR